MNKNIFCVDIGGSKLICAVLNPCGEMLDSVRKELPVGYTVDILLGYISNAYSKLKVFKPLACGVAVPGLCDYKTGKWLYSPFSGLENIPITKLIHEMTHLPTFADNDVNVSALAEKYFGVCRETTDFLWITVSNGIGGGLYLDNRLFRGQNLAAGEIGHIIVEENGRKCGCGNKGCLEAHASGASIAAIYRERTGCDITAKEIAQKARSGEQAAIDVWREAGEHIGRAAASAVNLLGIDTIVIGGGAAEAFDLLEPAISSAVERYVFKRANPSVKILHSKPGSFAALMGCAALVLENQGGIL